MKFADKLILLRKRNGMSQEELADKLDVSRQSVSKWESEQSMPELSKILQIAQLFDVSTDYLLKEDTDTQSSLPVSQTKTSEDDSATKKVSQSEVEQYLKHSNNVAKLYTIATALCILSPVPLLILLANSAFTLFSPTLSIILGIVGLLVFVCLGVGCFVYSKIENQQYYHFSQQNISLDNATRKTVEATKSAYYPIHIRNIIIGTVLCILSFVPIIIFPLLVSQYIGVGICVTLVVVIVAVSFFVYSYTKMSALNKLLNAGEYSAQNKKVSIVMQKILSAYWMLVVAIFLLYSFITNDWGRSWIVWPVAGVPYAVVLSITEIFVDKKVNGATNNLDKNDNNTSSTEDS